MGEIWISEAERLGDRSIGGAMVTPKLPGRTTWHSTESGAGDAAFRAVAEWLIAKAAESHILYDPTTDRLGQFGPLNESARALRNAGDLRTNRTGKVNIQVEVLARAERPFTTYWRPGPNFKALMRAIRSWGIPDVAAAGRFSKSPSDDLARSESVWLSTGGHYGHCHVPGNDHWDPGAIDLAALFAAAPVASPPKPKPTYEPFPGVAFFMRGDEPAIGKSSPIFTAMGKRLIAKGFGRYYSVGAGPRLGWADVNAYQAFQRSLGYSGAAATWPPGPTSWAKLQVPNV